MGKLCIDCRFHYQRPSGAHECKHIRLRRPDSLITGVPEPTWCDSARIIGCGTGAILFVQKEKLSTGIYETVVT